MGKLRLGNSVLWRTGVVVQSLLRDVGNEIPLALGECFGIGWARDSVNKKNDFEKTKKGL